MTIEYERIPTSYEVYNAILTQHWNVKSELCKVRVFESYTDIRENGVNTIYTVWGLKDAEVPLVGARTYYDTEDEKIVGEKTHEYWLCSPYYVED